MSSILQPSEIAQEFSESKCLCLNFEVRGVRSTYPGVETFFDPGFFFVRKLRHPAKTPDVTPLFSVTYAPASAVSLLPTPPIGKANAGAASGAQISRKSRPNQRHAGFGLYRAFPSRERFPESRMDRGVI